MAFSSSISVSRHLSAVRHQRTFRLLQTAKVETTINVIERSFDSRSSCASLDLNGFLLKAMAFGHADHRSPMASSTIVLTLRVPAAVRESRNFSIGCPNQDSTLDSRSHSPDEQANPLWSAVRLSLPPGLGNSVSTSPRSLLTHSSESHARFDSYRWRQHCNGLFQTSAAA